MIFTGNVGDIIPNIMEYSKLALNNIFALAGMLIFFSGIFKVLENTKLLDKFSKFISKYLGYIFDKKDLDDKSVKYISMNIAGNMLRNRKCRNS